MKTPSVILHQKIDGVATNVSSIILNYIPSTIAGLGQTYLSTAGGGGGSGDVTTANLTSTVTGLGSAGYVSTGSLTSNYYTYVQGPGRIGASSNLQINGTNPQLNAWTEDIAASVNSGTAITIDCLYNNYRITMTGNVAASNFTFTSNNLPTGKVFGINLWITQDATGSRTLGWPTTVKWPGATAPALTTTANKTDIFNIVTYDKGSNWFGFVAGKNY